MGLAFGVPSALNRPMTSRSRETVLFGSMTFTARSERRESSDSASTSSGVARSTRSVTSDDPEGATSTASAPNSMAAAFATLAGFGSTQAALGLVG